MESYEKIFNALLKNLRNMSGVNVETFKKHLDKFLILVPDEPNCPGYRKYIRAASNSIVDQVRYRIIN